VAYLGWTLARYGGASAVDLERCIQLSVIGQQHHAGVPHHASLFIRPGADTSCEVEDNGGAQFVKM
jgi:hypothetical protein